MNEEIENKIPERNGGLYKKLKGPTYSSVSRKNPLMHLDNPVARKHFLRKKYIAAKYCYGTDRKRLEAGIY